MHTELLFQFVIFSELKLLMKFLCDFLHRHSLKAQKWCVIEADSKLQDIQSYLELSVQKSSCEHDRNKDRLFVYIKEQCTLPLSKATIGMLFTHSNYTTFFLFLFHSPHLVELYILVPVGLK